MQVKTPVAVIITLSSVHKELRQQNAQRSVWFDDKEVIATVPLRRKTRAEKIHRIFSTVFCFNTAVNTVLFPPQ